jgi:hypothetical protein
MLLDVRKAGEDGAMHMGKVFSGVMGALLLTSAAALAQQPSAAAQVKANTEARLEGVIESKLEQQDALVGRGLDARVTGTQVTLTGSVKSEDDKALAGRVAMVPGVNEVNNMLEVHSDTTLDPVTAKPATTQGEQESRRALSDPYRLDPLVGTSPQERIVERDKMLRTMGMEDPKLKKQREQQKASENKTGDQ